MRIPGLRLERKVSKPRQIAAGTPRLSAMAANEKLILHLDVDAFFASVEQLLIPALRGRPVVVGCGVIASCSYEAREFGLRAAMSLRRARQLCPQVEVLKGDSQIYRCFAEQIWRIAREYTTSLETYLDEAYGDASGMEGIHGPPISLGRELQKQVLDEVGLPISVGLGPNRMMAKLASSSVKPRGVAWIAPGTEERFLTDLPVEKLPGVGPKTLTRLHDMNIRTVGQLRAIPRSALGSMFAGRGELLYELKGQEVVIVIAPLGPVEEPPTICRLCRTPYEGKECPVCKTEKGEAKRVICPIYWVATTSTLL